MRNTMSALIVLVLAVLALGGCSSSDGDDSDVTTTTAATEAGEGQGDGAQVSVVNFAFEPSEVSISVGESVTWTNDGSGRHTTTANDGLWNQQLGAGESFTEIFDTAGTFDFFCSIHPAMTGTVTVGG